MRDHLFAGETAAYLVGELDNSMRVSTASTQCRVVCACVCHAEMSLLQEWLAMRTSNYAGLKAILCLTSRNSELHT